MQSSIVIKTQKQAPKIMAYCWTMAFSKAGISHSSCHRMLYNIRFYFRPTYSSQTNAALNWITHSPMQCGSSPFKRLKILPGIRLLNVGSCCQRQGLADNSTVFSCARCAFCRSQKVSQRTAFSSVTNIYAKSDRRAVSSQLVCVPHQFKTWNGSSVHSRCYTLELQKHTTASLSVKRPPRKKIPKSAVKDMEQVDIVVAYAVAEELNLSHLKEALLIQGLYDICDLPIDVQDALHVRAKYAVDEKKREIFFFRDGSAVFWSVPEVERKEVLKFIQKHGEGCYSPCLILREREEMDLKYIREPTNAMGDTLQLNEECAEGHAALEKYAFSNAMAQSVKLAIWESILEDFVESIEFVTEDLRDGKKIRMSRREVLQKTGELFTLRHLINLSSDLLDTPDFYWDRAVLEPLYTAVYNYLEISRRTKVMNEKLNHCCELTELLSSHLNDAHHTRLELMIIILIMVEVGFEILHYVERYFSVPVVEADNVLEISTQDSQRSNST